ncbi:glutamate--cysteine ligase [Coemansia aciculifera]|uniref:Glutamate--cysteine ligase n=1 Tax=Coemansia aciculifera TaxID=417176 RepID=A0ACC1M6F8_9FUNG|nr:glutamate--cysteine ligase [Coemansia aciculifera]
MTRSHPPTTYSWRQILPRMEEIRKQATTQFISAWRSSQMKQVQDFTWHETMGYVIVKRDDAARLVVLSPRVADILGELGCSSDASSVGNHPLVRASRRSSRSGGSDDDNSSSNSGSNADDAAARTTWRPAHARFALRCEPPYLRAFSVQQLVREIPECLRARRRLLKSKLKDDEMLLSITQFPLLGVTTGMYIDGQGPANGPILRSQLLSDECLHQIPPFSLEIDGIVERRGAVPHTAVPVFHDKNTPWPFVDPGLSPAALDLGILRLPDASSSSVSQRSCSSGGGSSSSRARDSGCQMLGVSDQAGNVNGHNRMFGALQADHTPASSPLLDIPSNRNCLLLDSPLFGVGSGGVLRVTLCAADLDEARVLYDHLAPISAMMIALTAATPIVRGYLSDRDSYWDVQCSAVDDRSAQERGFAPLTTAKGKLIKSRFGTIDSYLGPGPNSEDKSFNPQYNDNNYTYDSGANRSMLEGGVDEGLAQHVARLFIRDLHFATAKMLRDKDDATGSRSNGQEHFKRFLGCNRQNVCLYPPNTRTRSGWEVEFMSLEVQLTDAENAAFITFIVLLSRVIISYRLNLYLPISMMDQNMTRAQCVNAAKDQLFFFRRDLFSGRDGKLSGIGRISGPGNSSNWYATYARSPHNLGTASPDTAEYVELTIDEIFNGSPTHKVTGLLNIVLSYLPTMRLEYDVEQDLRRQLMLVRRRASGKLCTLASWMRKFVHEHPDYRHDSIVSPSVNYDMLRTMNDIEEGRVAAPELFGK